LNTGGCEGFHPSPARVSRCGDRGNVQIWAPALHLKAAAKHCLRGVCGSKDASVTLGGAMCHPHKKKAVQLIDKQPKGRVSGEVYRVENGE